MKNKNLLPLLAVAGGLYFANQTEKKASTTQEKALAFTGDTFADEEALKDALIKVLKSNNVELRTLLRGSDGKQGEKGEKGDTGTNGNLIQNYGSSLIINGSFEQGDLTGWTPVTNQQLILDSANGNKIVMYGESIIENSTQFKVDANSIYKVSAKVSVIGTGGVIAILLKSGSYIVGDASYFQVGTFEREIYFCGIGANKFPSRSCNVQLAFSSNANVTSSTISNIIVSKVSKGEVVPHNLPYLPLNQTVLNSTTGKVGIFNGTTVDYYM